MELQLSNGNIPNLISITRQKSSHGNKLKHKQSKDELSQVKKDGYLTFMEFNNIQLKNIIPTLVIDIVYHLTGKRIKINMNKVSGSIIDIEEKLNTANAS